MDFDSFIAQAWKDHAKNPAAVADRLDAAVCLAEKNEQIPPLARLASHVLGEHLGEWQRGISQTEKLKSLEFFEAGSEAEKAIDRYQAGLEIAAGQSNLFPRLSRSDKISALALAASALNGQKEISRAQEFFQQALALSAEGLDSKDPANRALAVSGHNISCSLEEKPELNAIETELMFAAAQAARKFWEIAGTYLETERAEHQLATVYLRAKKFAEAKKHANLCIEISQKNQAPALELFFGYLVLAKIEKAEGNDFGASAAKAKEYFLLLSDGDKGWCEPLLNGIN